MTISCDLSYFNSYNLYIILIFGFLTIFSVLGQSVESLLQIGSTFCFVLKFYVHFCDTNFSKYLL